MRFSAAKTSYRRCSEEATVRLMPTGVLISWATPATSRPSAASFSASISEACVSRKCSSVGFRGFPRAPHLLLAALALGDLFRRDIDGDDLAARRPERMPIGDPGPFFRLVGALPGHLDPGDRLTGYHDRANNLFHRVGQSRHAVPDRPPEMIFDGDAAYLGETLIDLKIAAIRRQAGKPDRRRVVDELQRRLRKQQHSGFRCGLAAGAFCQWMPLLSFACARNTRASSKP